MFASSGPITIFRVLAIVSMFVTSMSLSTGASAQFSEDSPDLVAMLLRASDYDIAGLDGDIVRYSGTCLTAPQYAAQVAESYSMDPAEMASTLEDIGLGDSCEAYYGLPSQPGERSAPLVQFRSYVHHFEDEDAAAEGFAFLEDESDDPTHTDVPEGIGLGDESEATVSSGQDEAGAYQMIDLSFRVGHIHGGVTISDYMGNSPDPAAAVDLAEEMIDRVESALDGDAPNLSSMLAPMTGDGLPPLGVARYDVFDGKYEMNLGETAEAHNERIEKWAGEENVFLMGQVIPPAEGERPVQYAVYLAEFGTGEQAIAYVENTMQRLAEDEENFDIVENSGVPQYGDASIAVTYGSNANGTTSQLDRMYVAVGTYVISTYFVYTTIPAGVIEAPTAVQVACVENGGCSDTVPVPEAFGGPPAASGSGGNEESGQSPDQSAFNRIARSLASDEDAEADPGNDRDVQASGDESFASEVYPYAIAYSDDWTLQDPEQIGDMELLSMSNGTSGVVIIVDTAHGGDVEACLDGAIAYIEDQEDVVSIEVMEDENGDALEGSSNDAAYMAIVYELEDGSGMALYAECRVVTEGEATMEFNQFVPLDAFEDEIDAREELLAGIQIDN